MKPAIIFSLLAIIISSVSFADDKDFSSDIANRQEQSKIKKTIGVSFSNQYAFSALARLGVDVTNALEAGVELHGSTFGVVGAGLYAKAMLDKEDGLYGIAGVSKTKWFDADSNNSSKDGLSIGVGKEFRNGGFIEARTGIVKTHFKDPCVHNDYGNCVAGGTENSPLITLTVGKTF